MTTPTRTTSLAVMVGPTDHRLGPDRAPVTLIEYGDYECPVCASVEPAAKLLRAAHRSDLAFVFRHYPIESAHPHALLAAEAAESAGAQGKFWPMHDLLMTNPRHLSRHHLDGYAAQLGLDMGRFKAELDDEIYRQRVREHQDGGNRSHLRATPAFFVDGVLQDVSGGVHALFERVAAQLATGETR